MYVQLSSCDSPTRVVWSSVIYYKQLQVSVLRHVGSLIDLLAWKIFVGRQWKTACPIFQNLAASGFSLENLVKFNGQ